MPGCWSCARKRCVEGFFSIQCGGGEPYSCIDLVPAGRLRRAIERETVQFDGMSSRNLERLLETLTVRVVEVPDQPIHHAFGRWQDAQHACWTVTFGELVSHLLANRDWARRKLDLIGIARMHPMTLPSFKAD